MNNQLEHIPLKIQHSRSSLREGCCLPLAAQLSGKGRGTVPCSALIFSLSACFRCFVLKVRTLIFGLLLISLAACVQEQSTTPTIPPAPAAATPDTSGLSRDEYDTLSSLEKVDEYPFYVMKFVGDYPYPQTSFSLDFQLDFSCSLFASLGTPGDMFYGRNFDWSYSPSMLLFTQPTDGFQSVSMVDLTFLDITPDASKRLLDLPLKDRTVLLTSPSMPFDGMNEYGLTVGMAAIPDEYIGDSSYDASKPTLGSIGIIRQVLDHARNVDEAVKLFESYNIDFRGGPPIHYLLADPSGQSILIEFYQGQMVQIPNADAWHMATNHLRCIAQGDGGCNRYRILSQRLASQNGQLDRETALQLLSEVDQDTTQWSVVYNMTSGDIKVVIGGNYSDVHSFHLDLIPPK